MQATGTNSWLYLGAGVKHVVTLYVGSDGGRSVEFEASDLRGTGWRSNNDTLERTNWLGLVARV